MSGGAGHHSNGSCGSTLARTSVAAIAWGNTGTLRDRRLRSRRLGNRAGLVGRSGGCRSRAVHVRRTSSQSGCLERNRRNSSGALARFLAVTATRCLGSLSSGRRWDRGSRSGGLLTVLSIARRRRGRRNGTRSSRWLRLALVATAGRRRGRRRWRGWLRLALLAAAGRRSLRRRRRRRGGRLSRRRRWGWGSRRSGRVVALAGVAVETNVVETNLAVLLRLVVLGKVDID